MHVPDRVYGIETEYGCILQRRDGTIISPDSFPLSFLAERMSRDENKLLGLILPGCRLWHTNGSLTYIDTGNHPEHATPEARSVRDAVACYKAGDRLMTRAFSCVQGDECAVLLFKNNLSHNPQEVTHAFGCHENYLTHSSKHVLADTSNAFVPFLVTRQIFDGAGCWDRDGSFFMSQRTLYRGCREAPFPVGVKDPKGERSGRLHLTIGDSNILEFASFLKLGTTSLVLSLIESGWTSRMKLLRPTIDCYHVSQSSPKERLIHVPRQGWTSALDIQIYYLEAVRHYLTSATFDSEETAHECRAIVAAWEDALNALFKNDTAWMLGRIDWVTKRWFAERQSVAKKKSEASKRMREDFDILYHAIAEGSLQERMSARWHDRRIVTDDEIAYAMDHPPSRTRACLRAGFVHSVMNWHVSGLYVDWEYMALQESDQLLARIALQDPLADTNNDIHEFIKRLALHNKK
ncbi:MAG: proteasome accessory factor PafA2 family protein [bacterium]|nr:proteasome accessory factor PafA2 family protein [bacterium]